MTAYDADGNPVSVTHPSYSPQGQAPIVAVSKDAYNNLGELTSETDPAEQRDVLPGQERVMGLIPRSVRDYRVADFGLGGHGFVA